MPLTAKKSPGHNVRTDQRTTPMSTRTYPQNAQAPVNDFSQKPQPHFLLRRAHLHLVFLRMIVLRAYSKGATLSSFFNKSIWNVRHIEQGIAHMSCDYGYDGSVTVFLDIAQSFWMDLFWARFWVSQFDELAVDVWATLSP